MNKLLIAALMAAAPVAAVGAVGVSAVAQVPAGTELGPRVGAKAPAFSVVDTAGKTRTLASIAGARGATVVFVRSADWCPFCKTQLKNLNEVAAELDTLGWPMVAISYDSTEVLAGFATANGLGYPLMSDVGSKAIDAFGIRNESVSASPRFNGIPHPIILFIAKDGTVKAKLYEEAYQKRPPSELVVATAKRLN